MRIKTVFENKTLPDKFAKKAENPEMGYATASFPFEIVHAPDQTKSFAWTFVDYDSIPVCGFAYIHWVVANVPADKVSIEEDFSHLDQNHVKGKNSLVSKFLVTDYSAIDDGYMGPYPPDKDHACTLTVYALDKELDLTDGFYMNELLHQVEGHVLATAKIDLIGRC